MSGPGNAKPDWSATSAGRRLLRLLEPLRSLLSLGARRNGDTRRPRITFPTWPGTIYAVGDVHGSLGLLKAMDELILSDCERTPGSKLVVMLGDYVDRGPHSAQVLDWLMAPMPGGVERICLAGNHEQAMLTFLSDPVVGGRWLDWGGKTTLASYGIDLDEIFAASRRPHDVLRALSAHIPEEHIAFLEQLPVMVRAPGVVLAHAGLREGVPLELQTDDDLLWLKDGGSYRRKEADPLLVHGHTPAPSPLISRDRICIDTQAFSSGELTAVRLTSGDRFEVLTCKGERWP